MNRAELMAALERAKPAPEPLEVPELGGTIYLRELSVADIDKGRTATNIVDPDGKYATAVMLCRLICDAQGERIFDFANQEDLEFLSSSSFRVMNRVINKHNEMTGAAAAKNVSQVDKNS